MNKESRFSSGAIVRYPYLWRWQSDKGREHGEKDRLVCLAMALPDPRQKLTHLSSLLYQVRHSSMNNQLSRFRHWKSGGQGCVNINGLG
ncbi:hypothetical protein FHW16_005622 [Phyllobacterium myrsinacearum]|uniref:Uncharacterized protein n=1 Tax=Phyllobacterium myrsinacearum TaxID=28101 RepID=A0A839EUU2_9HYPH|nr:hypothetical protein [Phyllobacterium myrsinacearum]